MTEQKQLTIPNWLPTSPPIAEEAEIDIELLPHYCVDTPYTDSIKRYGVIDRIVVTRQDDGTFVVTDGKRRLESARKAGLETIPAKIYNISSAVSATISIIKNKQRSSNPISELDSIIELLQQPGMTINIISDITTMPIGTIKKRLQLLALNDKLMHEVREGSIGNAKAEEISKLTANQQAELVKILETNGKITGKDIAFVKQVRKSEAVEALPDSLFNIPVFVGKTFCIPPEMFGDLREAVMVLKQNAPQNKVAEILEKSLE